MAIIEFTNIHLSFNDKSVIQDLSMTINKGDKVVISGKSGSGKSSLLSLVLGFIQPDRGEVLFNGVPVDEGTVWDIRRRIAFIDQDVSLGAGSVKDLLAFTSALKANSHIDHAALVSLMGSLHLDDDLLLKNIKDLSGGERQRMAVVIAALLGREVFFLDEVTASLDKHMKKKVADLFLDRRDWTCVIVSHDPVWLDYPTVRVFDFEEKKWKH